MCDRCCERRRQAGGARLTVRARDLVGEEACAAIIKLVRESDAELNAERKAKREATGKGSDGAKEAGDAQ